MKLIIIKYNINFLQYYQCSEINGTIHKYIKMLQIIIIDFINNIK